MLPRNAIGTARLYSVDAEWCLCEKFTPNLLKWPSKTIVALIKNIALEDEEVKSSPTTVFADP